MWETDTERPSGVSYGLEGATDTYGESTAERVTYKSATDGKQKRVYIHKLWIEGLQPGRTYHYQITGPDVRSETFQFHTTPAQTDEVRFIVYGDTRTQPKVHRALVEQMMKHPVDFVVHGGDLVTSGDDYRLWGPQFFETMKGLVERVPIYLVKGNHEGRSGTYEKLLAPPGAGSDFAFDYGPLHYFCLDNVYNKKSGSQLVSQIARDATASKAQWKLVTYHIPSVNFGGHESAWQQKDALPAFAAAGIDFVVTGHSHQYERFRPVMLPGGGSCVTYITAGGGGAPLAPVGPTPCHVCAQAVYHFCLFHIQGGHLTMDTIDEQGRTIDHLDVTKTDGHLDTTYLSAAMPACVIPLCRSLCTGMENALSAKPAQGQPCTLSFDVAVPPLPEGVKLIFALRSEAEAYRLPPPYSTTVSAEGGKTHVKLVATPLTAVRVPKGTLIEMVPIEPALWIDCHYEFGGVKETVSRRAAVSGSPLLRKLVSGWEE
jgi:acid phosphatase type 7